MWYNSHHCYYLLKKTFTNSGAQRWHCHWYHCCFCWLTFNDLIFILLHRWFSLLLTVRCDCQVFVNKSFWVCASFLPAKPLKYPSVSSLRTTREWDNVIHIMAFVAKPHCGSDGSCNSGRSSICCQSIMTDDIICNNFQFTTESHIDRRHQCGPHHVLLMLLMALGPVS